MRTQLFAIQVAALLIGMFPASATYAITFTVICGDDPALNGCIAGDELE